MRKFQSKVLHRHSHKHMVPHQVACGIVHEAPQVTGNPHHRHAVTKCFLGTAFELGLLQHAQRHLGAERAQFGVVRPCSGQRTRLLREHHDGSRARKRYMGHVKAMAIKPIGFSNRMGHLAKDLASQAQTSVYHSAFPKTRSKQSWVTPACHRTPDSQCKTTCKHPTFAAGHDRGVLEPAAWHENLLEHARACMIMQERA